jgi:hypothetical protein
VWTFDKAAREYYYHVFYDFQPDLNMNNPDVRAEIMRIMGYWLQLGVAGFRVDAVPFIIQDPPLKSRKRAKLHFAWLEEMRRFLQWRSRDAILLGSAFDRPAATRPTIVPTVTRNPRMQGFPPMTAGFVVIRVSSFTFRLRTLAPLGYDALYPCSAYRERTVRFDSGCAKIKSCPTATPKRPDLNP